MTVAVKPLAMNRKSAGCSTAIKLTACSFIVSGRNIINILEKNPSKDPSKYDQDDLGHMRKVVNYCKRHLAQVCHSNYFEH